MTRHNLRSTAHPLAARLRVAVYLVAGLTVAVSSGIARSADPETPDWEQSTRVETGGTAAAANAANPVCAPLAAHLMRRLATIQSLRAANKTAAEGPPTSVKSALQSMFGTPEPNAKMIANERKMANERKAADDLNVMLKSSNCAPVDIDSALAQKAEQELDRPVAPRNVMPEDLVPTPRQY